MAKEKFEFHLPLGENSTSFSLSLEAPQCTLNDCTFSAGFVDFIPTIPPNAFFLSIFGFLIILQLYFGIKYRTIGFTTTMLVGLALEVMGYVGAIQMHFSYPIPPPAMIGLTLGPIFIAAAVYICLEHLRRIYDPKGRPSTRARIYTWIFCIASLIGLVMQIAGALLAGFAEDQTKLRIGAVVLAVGYATQFHPLSLSCILYLRFYKSIKCFSCVKETKHLAKIEHFILGLLVAGILILIRCTFRVVEFSLPFGNLIAHHEAFALGFDGALMVLACFILTAMHPGRVLTEAYQDAKLQAQIRDRAGKEEVETYD